MASITLIGGGSDRQRILSNGERVLRIPKYREMKAPAHPCHVAETSPMEFEQYRVETIRFQGGYSLDIGVHSSMTAYDAMLRLVESYGA